MASPKREEGDCSICGYHPKIPKYLEKHMRIHTGEAPFQCSECGKAYFTKFGCTRHELSHTRETPFECGICFKKFTEKGSLKKHMGYHTGENMFKCSICDRIFAQKGHLQSHLQTHSSRKILECSLCNKTFRRIDSYNIHKLINHNEGKVYPCTVCSKTFPLEAYLTKHMLLHSDDNPFTCLICNKKFTKNSKLKIHALVHSEKKPFECLVCHKLYKTQDGFKQHSLSHAKDNPYKCHICNRDLTGKRSLTNHMSLHSGKTFSCPHCDICVQAKASLASHIKKTHAGIMKPYCCPECNMFMSDKRSFDVHMKKHTAGADPFECIDCGKAYLLRCYYEAHMSSIHGVNLANVEESVYENTKTHQIKQSHMKYMKGKNQIGKHDSDNSDEVISRSVKAVEEIIFVCHEESSRKYKCEARHVLKNDMSDSSLHNCKESKEVKIENFTENESHDSTCEDYEDPLGNLETNENQKFVKEEISFDIKEEF